MSLHQQQALHSPVSAEFRVSRMPFSRRYPSAVGLQSDALALGPAQGRAQNLSTEVRMRTRQLDESAKGRNSG